ncbi:right-handed parallel beta-helix repeat-containing protein [Chitinophaga sp. Cy-1792]|uniref:right-handed parallel beta-helix repeat-containing protein n=1 Tax=Chitinophaga sp. Cy-1792 TaxID=2608339 RepID=UPI001420DAE4|nr:right-handed parallel beta-helix repeat-containing protein [Chitinophaga sp. Cy-1792]NIG57492.1 right-handed parallel beta-helix repeat-containing protein [Chitinophaga sp. Cy-1792]
MNIKQIFRLVLLLAMVATGCKKANIYVDTTPSTGGAEGLKGDVYGIWAKGSVQRVVGDIIVPAGKTLVIEEGVTVIMDTLAKPEFIVNGNLYSMGTAENPVKITIEEGYRTAAKKFGKQWGGILASPTCAELLLDNTILEYGGSTTTDASSSVKMGLYKAISGENLPALWFSNINGKLVVTNSIFRNFQEDCTYIEGGKILFSNNKFYTTGLTGGEGVNIKSGCIADVANNLFYSNNTNAMKLSNSGDRAVQAHVIAYNNTMINTGWRRPTVKGGSIWLEATVYAEVYNNLFANTRFGIKHDTKKTEDSRSVISNNMYYGYDQTTVTQFQLSTDVIGGKNEIRGTKAGENDPKFVNYPVETPTANYDFNTAWDFRVATGSPAIGGGTAAFSPNFTAGLVMNGNTYTSPVPSTTIGAFGAAGK